LFGLKRLDLEHKGAKRMAYLRHTSDLEFCSNFIALAVPCRLTALWERLSISLCAHPNPFSACDTNEVLAQQGKKLGAFLLVDALRRSLEGIRAFMSFAFIVDAKSEHVDNLYKRFGFIALSGRRLLLPMQTIERNLSVNAPASRHIGPQ
jgi:hypothetical protein